MNCYGNMPEHSWNLTPAQAVALQRQLVTQLQQTPLAQPPVTIAGADVSFNKYSPTVFAGIIVLSFPQCVPLAYACVREDIAFPYIPGLLSFREIPPLLKAWEMLPLRPDVVMVDGHGIAHPRRMGIAAHFGLVAGIPSLGAAKKLLYGNYTEPDITAGSSAAITVPGSGEILGMALRTKNKIKPMLVSPGHLMSVNDAIEITLQTIRGYRLPEPTRQAHLLVNAFRKGELGQEEKIVAVL